MKGARVSITPVSPPPAPEPAAAGAREAQEGDQGVLAPRPEEAGTAGRRGWEGAGRAGSRMRSPLVHSRVVLSRVLRTPGRVPCARVGLAVASQVGAGPASQLLQPHYLQLQQERPWSGAPITVTGQMSGGTGSPVAARSRSGLEGN